MKLTPAQFSKLIGVSTRRVNAAIHSGILECSLERKPYGQKTRYFIDKEEGMSEWANNIDPAKQRDLSKAAMTREMSSDKSSPYYRAKGVRKYYEAKLKELEYLKKAGNLVCAKKVAGESFKVGRIIRDNLLAVPARVSAEIAAMNDPKEISQLLKDNLSLALMDLDDLGSCAK